MFIILIPIFFFLVWFALLSRRPHAGFRETFVKTLVVCFALVAAATEVLSFFGFLNELGAVLVWLAANLVLIGFVRRNASLKSLKVASRFKRKFGAAATIYFGAASFIYLMTLAAALYSPPNTYDSMTYHLARAANWIQFGSVEFYPTAILRQLYQPPLAEYALTHLQLLSGGDYFANLVQWLSLVACGAVVSLITKEFGQKTRAQAFAAFLSATLPGAIVQGSSTQNDLVASFLIAAFFYFWQRAERSGAWADFGWVGLALGLAVLTKGTAYIFCFPIGAFFFVRHFFAVGEAARRRFVGQTAAVVLLAIVFNAGFFVRNYELFGAPISTADDEVKNKNHSAKMILSNLARNYAINLGTYSVDIKNAVENSMKKVFGDELKNPDSTWMKNEFRVAHSTHEDLTGNPIHILLITLALPLIFLIRGDNGRRKVYAAIFAILCGFLLFSSLLKWQIYGTRLQLPLFMLGCAAAAFVFARLPSLVAAPAAVIVFAFALPALFFAEPRAILSDDWQFVLPGGTRQQKYFNNSEVEAAFTGAVGYLESQPNAAESIGLMIGFNDYEYPYWCLLKDDFSRAPYIYHVNVTNVSARLAGARVPPEFVISTRPEKIIEGVEYVEVWKRGAVKILRKKPPQ